MIFESAGELMHARQWESNLDLVLGQGHGHEIKRPETSRPCADAVDARDYELPAQT
jgi:hypothetical protein